METARLQTGHRVVKSSMSTSLRFEGTRMHADFADPNRHESVPIRVRFDPPGEPFVPFGLPVVTNP